MTLPQPSGEFHWTQEAWGSGLRCAPLLERASHVFTTRALVLKGVPGETAAAWAQAAAAVGASADQLVRLRQVHGARVVEAVRAVGPSSEEDWPEADVSISDDPQMGLVVRVADCVPVLMADSRTGAVAAVHAGWRGTSAGAALAAVAALGRTYGARPSDIIAAIGPSIGPCCYIVGPELVDQFSGHPESAAWFIRDETLRLDLWQATRDQLLRAGVMDSNIHDSRLCTACHTDVFCSYRKERDKTGRMVGVIRAAAGRT
jgi:polyphenol oxidase